MENLIAWFGENAWAFGALLVWALYWKGVALWKAARLGQKGWFVALLVINTVGILEILYLYLFSPKSASQASA